MFPVLSDYKRNHGTKIPKRNVMQHNGSYPIVFIQPQVITKNTVNTSVFIMQYKATYFSLKRQSSGKVRRNLYR